MFFDNLRGFIEDAGSIYLERERIRTQSDNSNQPGNAPFVETGQDHVGNTIVDGQLISGVSNGTLLAGVAAVLIGGAVVAALAFD